MLFTLSDIFARRDKKDTRLFHRWVPRWLGLTFLVLLFFPILFVNGAYTSNAGEMTAGLGIIAENIQFANFMTAVGMAVVAPFLLPVMRLRRPKMVFTVGLLTMALFGVICAKTTSMPLLFLCSFILGSVRMILLLGAIFAAIDYATGMDILKLMFSGAKESPEEAEEKDRLKALGLPFLYLFMLSVAQLGSALTARLAFEYEWQNVYWWMFALVLTALLGVLALMRRQPWKKGAKMNWTHLGDLVAAAFSLSSLSYVLVFGKTLDWFDHPSIRLAGAVFLVSTAMLAFLAANGRNRYIDPAVFKSRRVRIGLLLFLLAMALSSSSMFVSVFTGVSMKLDNVQNARLSNWSLAGYAIGIGITFVMTKRYIAYRWMFVAGFGLITVSAAYLFFQYQSAGLYRNMIPAVILRSAGMMMLYTLGGIYGMLRLQMNRFFGSWLFLMLAVRSVVGPVAGFSLYSNGINERMQHYTVRLAEKADGTNLEAVRAYEGVRLGMVMQGRSREQAEQMAATSLKGRIQVQATLAALKRVTGWTIWWGIGCIVLTIVYPTRKRRRKPPAPETVEKDPNVVK